MQTKFLKRSASFLLALIIFVGVLPIPDFQANAHEAAVLKTYIDADNMNFQTSVEYEDSGFMDFGSHEGEKLLNLDNYDVPGNTFTPDMVVGLGVSGVETQWNALINSGFSPDVSYDSNGNEIQSSTTSSSRERLNVPAKQLVLGWPSSKNDASPSDMKRATLVGTTLTKSLNSVLQFYTDGGKGSSPAENIRIIENIMGEIDPAVLTDGIDGTKALVEDGYRIYYATGTKPTIKINGVEVPSYDAQGNLYCYMFKGNADEFNQINDIRDVSSAIWAMPKGTRSIVFEGGGPDIPAIGDENLNDVAYVTMFMIAQQAIQAVYKDDNYISMSKTPKTTEPGLIEKGIYRLFDGIFAGLRAFLGLSEMDELIFNKGGHGGALYEDGLMHATWWNVVLKYYTILQLIAWMAIALAIAKTLISINMGTISANPRQRKELMDSIVEFFTVGMLLTLCIPIIRLMVQVNNGLVDVFAAGYTGDMGQAPQASGLLVSLCVEIFMFMMTFYANFIYILRSITIAILVAMGPICIVSMAFSKKNSVFEKWLQELSANIFIQAFHAFAFSFLFEAICQGGRNVERIAVIYAIFPITEFARNLLFQGAGSTTVSTGIKFGDAAKRMTTSVAAGIGGAAVGMGAQKLAGIAAGGDIAKAAEITGKGGLGGSSGSGKSGGGGSGGSVGGLSALGAAGRALQSIKPPDGASDAENASVSSAKFWGGLASASAGVASGLASAVGGMSNIMSGIATGDPDAVRKGVEKTSSAVVKPFQAAGDHFSREPRLSGGTLRNAGYVVNGTRFSTPIKGKTKPSETNNN